VKEIAFQKRNGVPVPFTDEDADKWAEFKENQITRHKVSGVTKERSWKQLKMLHACLKLVANNTESKNWNTLEKAKLSLKVALNFYDEGVVVVDKQGNVHMKYRSFGYESLPHMEANRLFDRAWPYLAGVIGITVEDLLKESERETV
jgi:transcriptional regulator with PAS, ATPase and Fis domain